MGLLAGVYGAIAASSLIIGALIALVRTVPKRQLGLIMAFGSGVLISSVAYELVEEAVAIGGQIPLRPGWPSGRSSSSSAIG